MEVRVLMDLAAADPVHAGEHLARAYEWRRSAFDAVAKGVTGAGVAAALTPILPLLAQDANVDLQWGVAAITWAAAGALVVAGAVIHARTRRIETEYLTAQSLLAELNEIHPFLRLYLGRVV